MINGYIHIMKPWNWTWNQQLHINIRKFIFILLESAADKPIVVIPDNINKWAGEDDDDDVKVS